jgi:hypothetical protein
MGVTIKKKPVTAEISVQHSHKGEVVTEQHHTEDVGDVAITAHPCEVGFEASLTLNMGNFNSTRMGVSIMIPALHSEIDEVFEFAKDWVNDRMGKLAEEAKES